MEKNSAQFGQTTAAKRTYMLLQKTFLELLGEIPFDKITLTELCDRSMVPRSTFYRYFEDKYDFLRFCLRSFLAESGFDESAINMDDDKTFLMLFLTVLSYLEEHKTQYQKLCRVNDTDGSFWQTIQDYLTDMFRAGIRKAQENGRKLLMEEDILITFTTDFCLSAFRCYMSLPEGYSALQYANDIRFYITRSFFAEAES